MHQPMHHHTGSLRSHDGLTLHTHAWLPEDAPRATVVLVHGYAEHAGRYDAFARALVDAGLAVRALDLRGHGRSEGPRAQVEDFHSFVSDLTRFVDGLDEAVGEPRFLFGHSMGGLIATRYVLEHPGEVDGLLLSSPYFEDRRPTPPWLLRSVGFLARFVPGLPTLDVDPAVTSRDETAVKAYRNDPLVTHGRVKARIGVEMTEAGRLLLRRAEDLRVPLLVFHGGGDRLASPTASRAFYERAGSDDKTYVAYEGGFHELLNDVIQEKVTRDVLAWLEARLPRREGSAAGGS